MSEKDADIPILSPSPSPYYVSDFDTQRQDDIDLLNFIALSASLGVSLLPITWQFAHGRVGMGASGDVRQALVDVDTGLAFKIVKDVDKASQRAGTILRVFANEIAVMSRPHVQAHPHIADLLGVCWDIPPTGRIWPGLVFEKS